MKKINFYWMIPAISLLMLSCKLANKDQLAGSTTGSTAFDIKKAKSFIDSINAKFTEQVKNGDSVALASHYWPDAELLLSNSEAIKGQDILSAWGSMIRMGVKDMTFATTDLTGDADFLIETGTYEMKGENNSLLDKGKYVVVWKQENGVWKLYRDMGNTNLPAPASK